MVCHRAHHNTIIFEKKKLKKILYKKQVEETYRERERGEKAQINVISNDG